MERLILNYRELTIFFKDKMQRLAKKLIYIFNRKTKAVINVFKNEAYTFLRNLLIIFKQGSYKTFQQLMLTN